MDKDFINSIIKTKITKMWIKDEFKIEDKFLKTYKKTAQQVIDEIYKSIKTYPGPCPCPYNKYVSGIRRCGGNSAYSAQGGKSTLCFPIDVLKAN